MFVRELSQEDPGSPFLQSQHILRGQPGFGVWPVNPLYVGPLLPALVCLYLPVCEVCLSSGQEETAWWYGGVTSHHAILNPGAPLYTVRRRAANFANLAAFKGLVDRWRGLWDLSWELENNRVPVWLIQDFCLMILKDQEVFFPCRVNLCW